ncbi:MAG: TIGR00375 family protein [Thermoplasmata archaeon]|nr:MAG: TIGR00375 family protein [Thermoplasmata archaeon]
MEINCDLHIHSKYSIGSSKNMSIELLSTEAKKKGIQLLATGDCLHSGWLKEIKELEEIDDGTFEMNGTRFVLTTEVEDNHRVHHLLIFPSLSSTLDFRKKIASSSPNLDTDGRPNIAMDGEEIAQLAKDVEALIGPSHAFTPWTALYAYHDSLSSCYGDLEDYISFVELGLSADTHYADRIAELGRLSFLTNSDAHSPYPIRLAREFNRFHVKDLTYTELKKALLRKGGRKPILNVGLPPQEGKYNESACIKCFTHYTLREAMMHKWKCTKCGKRIKKGVKDRVNEIATYELPKHPSHRPKYLYLVPLAEIISKAIGQKSPQTKTVFKFWDALISEFNDEVSVLVDVDIEDIAKVTDERVTDAISALRKGRVIIHPGGGGQYGHVEFPGEDYEPEAEQKEKREGQMSLFEF